MRMNFLSCGVSLCLALTSATASAAQRWVYLGDVHVAELATSGRLSLNLDSLRKRGRHYEIWERVVIEPEPGRRGTAAAPGTVSERRTLWAIRCRFGEMAKVTEGTDGAFEPRAESPRFFSPRPDSPNAAVLDTTCAEVRRRTEGPSSDRQGTGSAANDFRPGRLRVRRRIGVGARRPERRPEPARYQPGPCAPGMKRSGASSALLRASLRLMRAVISSRGGTGQPYISSSSARKPCSQTWVSSASAA
jgi:hypothetical protein